MMAAARAIWHRYELMLMGRPVMTKGFVSGSLFACTDVCVQYGESRLDSKPIFEWNVRRTQTQALFGTYYGVVHAHFVWAFLERGFVWSVFTLITYCSWPLS